MRLLVMLVASLPSIASAEEEPTLPTPTGDAVAGVRSGEQPLVPAKRGVLHAFVGINLSTDTAGDPISISPDLWYGVNDKLTVGLVHSFVGATGLMGIPGTSLCISGDQCTDSFYNFVGLDARYTVKQGTTSIAAAGGLYAVDTDPFSLALKLGAVIHWRARPDSKLAVDFTPSLFLGVTERDGVAMTDGNKEDLILPGTVWYDVIPKLALGAQLALFMPIEDAGDFYSIAFALGGSYQVNHQISVDAAFALPFLAGGDGNPFTGVDARTFTIGGGYAF